MGVSNRGEAPNHPIDITPWNDQIHQDEATHPIENVGPAISWLMNPMNYGYKYNKHHRNDSELWLMNHGYKML